MFADNKLVYFEALANWLDERIGSNKSKIYNFGNN